MPLRAVIKIKTEKTEPMLRRRVEKREREAEAAATRPSFSNFLELSNLVRNLLKRGF